MIRSADNTRDVAEIKPVPLKPTPWIDRRGPPTPLEFLPFEVIRIYRDKYDIDTWRLVLFTRVWRSEFVSKNFREPSMDHIKQEAAKWVKKNCQLKSND